ncbi:iron-containing redox enzyme family protein [Halobacteriovorax sp. XZX-3]|uniref:iron-containing redox enzyme family protein n=1 Tax=unclassified Halobacteriovorax TaxID=2639665 RepID=UPI001304A224|nr:iron-containing redox enzyme family protein [Halobacteriovorax sp. DA5]
MNHLESLLNECVTQIIEEVRAIKFEDENVYANWLAQTYYYTSVSESILRTSAKHCKSEELSKRWLEHADEESGHENLALSDLKSLGYNICDFQEYEETKIFYQSQFYYANTYGGESVFGWVLALEAFAANLPQIIVNNLIQKYGKSATRFMKVHTDEDIEHIKKALEAVNQLPNKDIIINNMKETTKRYIRLLQACESSAQTLSKAS